MIIQSNLATYVNKNPSHATISETKQSESPQALFNILLETINICY
jgi:hypothetical protein